MIWQKLINFIICGLSDYMHCEEAYYDRRAAAPTFYCSSAYFFCSQSMFILFSGYDKLYHFVDIFMKKQCVHHVFEKNFWSGIVI